MVGDGRILIIIFQSLNNLGIRLGLLIDGEFLHCCFQKAQLFASLSH
jgi:hypothetical protein